MKRSRHTEKQIIGILEQHQAGLRATNFRIVRIDNPLSRRRRQSGARVAGRLGVHRDHQLRSDEMELSSLEKSDVPVLLLRR